MVRALAVVLAIGLGFGVSFALFRPGSVEPTPADDLALAWRAVSDRPQSAVAWVRLGELQASLDQTRAAERSYRTAVELGDPRGMARGRLGFLLYGQQRDEEALELLLAAREAGAQLPIQDYTITELRRRSAQRRAEAASPPRRPEAPLPDLEPSPPSSVDRPDAGVEAPDAGAEEVGTQSEDGEQGRACVVPLQQASQGSTFLIDVVLDGEEAELIVDTGASLTVITRELADDLGLDLDYKMSLTAVTANGTVEFPTAVLDEVELAEGLVRELRVAVCEGCVESLADGLLGLDLQSAFRMRLDLARGEAEVGRCGREG
jgi:clan AA aspartic protease (TIGR02281 family)